ncbi:MAG: hypothetical protein Q8S73_08875 [Deltaproteobacteria bacterium]|nr:hypothetical protein [Myxococcales bacterium]MDP3214203.1 hypothetical protein [Deltaproteobacteria bacterium]
MRPAALAIALLAGCSGAGRPTGPVTAARPRAATAAPVEVPAGWTRIAPRHRPARIDDVAALGEGRSVILAGSEVLLVSAEGAVAPSCALDPDLAPHGVYGFGARWWALAGEVFEPVVYLGDAGAAGCERVALPPLVTRDAPPGHLLSAQVGGEAMVWSSAGAMVRSRDGGHTWQRIPPLPEVLAVTVSGATLYAAALLGGPASRSPYDRHAYEVFALPATESRWAPLRTPGDRASPVALLPREGGGVVGVDVLGGFEVTAQGVATVGPSSGPHFARDRPSMLVPVSPDAAVGIAHGALFEHRLSGWRPLRELPGERAATAFDVAPDSTLLVSDGHELWRVDAGAQTTVVLRSPLGGGRPSRLAAAGPVIAAISSREPHAARDRLAERDLLSVTRDGGATWETTELPAEAGRARSLAVLPGGVVAVITAGARDAAAPDGALWVGAPALHRVELPRGARVFEGGATLHAIGDRWVLAAGDVFVSDDQGARWRRTLGPPPGRTESWGVVGLAAATGRTVYALDSAGALWRSDDAGDEFAAITPGRVREPAAPRTSSDWLRWDGDDALLASIGQQVFRFDREGRGGPLGALRGAVFGAAVEDGAVVATGSLAWVPECGRLRDPLLMVASGRGTLVPIVDVCARQAVAFALDGDALYTADADGTIERASLRGLWREALERDLR